MLATREDTSSNIIKNREINTLLSFAVILKYAENIFHREIYVESLMG